MKDFGVIDENGIPITGADWGADITEVKILEGVKNVGDYAFYECKTLSKVSLAESVEEIGNHSFRYCAFSEIKLPSKLKKIGDSAFCNSNIESIEIPESVDEVESYAFSYCSKLKEAKIFGNMNCQKYSYSENVFEGCTSLTDVYIFGDKTFGIGNFAFGSCSKLKNITIPKNIEYVDMFAFAECFDLETIYYDGKDKDFEKIEINSYGNETFKDAKVVCSEISIGETDEDDVYYSVSGGALTISGTGNMKDFIVIDENGVSVTGADWGADITEVKILDGVKNVGESAFYNCQKLSKVSLAESVEKIGAGSFYNCAFSEIKLPSKLKEIGNMAFWKSGIESIEVPKSVDTIENGAFESCLKLKEAKVFGCMNNYDTFEGCTSLTDVYILGSKTTTISNLTFKGCSALKNVSISKNVVNIGLEAFSGCSALEKVYYDGSRDKFDKLSIAAGNDSFKNAEIICSILSIGATEEDDVYYSVSNGILTISGTGNLMSFDENNPAPWGTDIVEVVIKEGVTNISKGAFDGCSELTKINVGAGILSIDKGAFDGCSKLGEIYFEGGKDDYLRVKSNIPSGIKTDYFKMFGDVDKDGEITFNDASLILDKVLDGGVELATDFEIADVNGDRVLTAEDASNVVMKVLDGAFEFEI